MQEIKANIPVLFFQESDSVVAYSPALDISTCGLTEAIARRRFSEAVELFLSEAAEMGTLNEILEECGWHKIPGREGWKPPVYTSIEESVNIPAGA